MRKFTTILASLAVAVSGFAQTEEAPNRLLITNINGNYQGYVIDDVKDLTFAKVEGEVNANIQLFETGVDMIKLSVTKTEACNGYMINVIPRAVANQITNVPSASRYLESLGSPTYFDDFTSAELTGMELNYNSEYSVMTVAFDNYGVYAGMSRADFKTPAPTIVGDPKVEAELLGTTRYTIKYQFVPNEDVTTYYYCLFEKGQLQYQFDNFGPMMGLTNIEDMIMRWGIANAGTSTYEWTGLDPNTDYEIAVVCKDMNGNMFGYQLFYATTSALGGEGESFVEIEPGYYGLSDWFGEEKLTQDFSFTPNDQTSAYRFGVYLKSDYDQNPEGYQQLVCSEPPMPNMANWWFFEPLTTDYAIDPNTEVVVIAAGKNINDEWGKVNVLEYTTPENGDDEMMKVAGSGKGIMSRIKPSKVVDSFSPGKAPVFNRNKLQLTTAK